MSAKQIRITLIPGPAVKDDLCIVTLGLNASRVSASASDFLSPLSQLFPEADLEHLDRLDNLLLGLFDWVPENAPGPWYVRLSRRVRLRLGLA